MVPRNEAPSAGAWQDATGLAPYSFAFDTATYGRGSHTIVTGLVSRGEVVAARTVRATFA